MAARHRKRRFLTTGRTGGLGRVLSLGQPYRCCRSRAQIPHQLLRASRVGWARMMREISDPRGSPQRAPRKAAQLPGSGHICRLGARKYNNNIEEILRPRWGAANLSPAPAHGTRTAEPPCSPFLDTKIHAALRTPEGPHCNEAPEAEKARKRKKKARTPFLNAGNLGLHHLRFLIAGVVAGHLDKF